ncbi:PQQ-like beta-propeller repeat protein [Parabacteroides sp. PF5-9]|uniref:PQQ-binding-like beta-propeller repeat protein n=1 Tax=Parabacteroides sp. PF5-9 TaxID=1742404 RepID=UPI002474AEA2|nr:PQQ-like beta-propeller repeat protein [Parabacteroides sp. PF5-9]MDH6358487.1 outer membrane protein assembly factor BamB [Parabacteroides sp. PF5-9]
MKTRFVSIYVIVLMVFIFGEATAQSPYGWRGPTRDGIYPETGLLKSWPADGPELLWESFEVGKGYSSPVIVGDRLYITGMNEDETQEIFSAYTLDGKKIYQVPYGTPWDKSYPETRTTPAIEGDKAYVISGSGEIVCFNTSDGAIVWKVDGGTQFERKTGNWGTSECPLVFDNKVIYTPSGDQTTMVALNAQTGAVVWKTRALGDTGAYVSPMLVTYKGKRQIIGSTGATVLGVNPDTGDIEWTFSDWRSEAMTASRPEWVNIAPNTPLFKDGRVFFCHGYDIGGYMLQLNETMTSATLLWKTDVLDTHHGGYVLVDGTIYGSNWINNNQGNWVGLDWNTGEKRFEEAWSGGKGKGSIVAADGMLYCYDERRGGVGLVKPSREKFDVVSEFRIEKGEGPHWAHPVIVNGTLYMRHGTVLMAYKVK